MNPDDAESSGWRKWGAALLVSVAIVGAVQGQAGAWHAGFGAYPDESSHFMGGLLVRDYIATGRGSPMEFARTYYLFHPYFAIGYWPPLFDLVEGGWMLALGHSRLSVMLLVGALAVVTALVLFRVVLRKCGLPWALLAAALFLLIPSVRWSSTVVMTDLPVTLMCLLTTLAFGRFFETVSWRWAIVAGVTAGLAMLTKYLSAFVLIPPALVLLVDRRWDLLLNRKTYAMGLAFLAVCGPWVYWSRRFMTIGVEGESRDTFIVRLQTLERGLTGDLGIILLGAAVAATLWTFVSWRRLSPVWKLLALQAPCASLFVLFAPTDVEPRYLMAGYAGLVATLTVAVKDVAVRWASGWRLAWLAPLLGIALFPAVHKSRYAALPSDLSRRVAEDLIGAGGRKGSAILVPTLMEGPMIVELAGAEPTRPDRAFVRPHKLLACTDWMGNQYQMAVADLRELTQLFDQFPIDVVLLAKWDGKEGSPHDTLLRSMVESPGHSWSRQRSYSDDRGLTIEVFARPPRTDLQLSHLLTFMQDRARQAP